MVKADTVLVHHPQSFLEGLFKVAADGHYLACREEAPVKTYSLRANAVSPTAGHDGRGNTIPFLLPTLFMELPISVETLRNLLRSQRGTFTTQ